MIRRVLVLLLVALAVIAVVADRLALQAAEHAIAVRAHQAALLRTDPDVHIRGFPFLTQAVRGRYDEIDIVTHGIHRGGVRLDTVSARFFGVHVPLSRALAGSVANVPVDRADGSVLITYTDLNQALAKRQVRVRADGGALAVTGPVSAGGRTVQVSARVSVSLSGGILTLAPLSSSLTQGGTALPAAARATAGSALAVHIRTGALPFGLQVRQVSAAPDGLHLQATASGLLVPVPADASAS